MIVTCIYLYDFIILILNGELYGDIYYDFIVYPFYSSFLVFPL